VEKKILKMSIKETEEGIMEDETEQRGSMKSFLWHGGSVYDAWFSCASNQVLYQSISHTKPIKCVLFSRIKIILICWQVAQVLLTLPYSFSQMGMASGVILQIFYGFMGSWTAYLISVLYVEYRSRKEKQNVNFNNHVIQVTLSKLSYRFSIIHRSYIFSLY